jgi:calcineurin-like phosphoesterase family protein
MIWFTADTHFFHSNILKYCNRPFANITENNETIIKNWNNVVSVDDIVYHLGDFSFGSKNLSSWIASRLNGRIFLLPGNHDKKGKLPLETDLFKITPQYYELKIQQSAIKNSHQLIVLCHYAFEVWNKRHYGSWHLHGHSHGGLPSSNKQLRLDVGVDCNNYTPVSIEQVQKIMKKKEEKK